jgi:hypothetical protein
VTRLAPLDGAGAAAVSEQLVAVYRAAMGAAPFFETEVETGWFAEELGGEVEEAGYRCWVATEDDRVVGFAYGMPTPEIPAVGWYGLVRDAVGAAAAGRAWLITHDLDTPARALYRSLGFQLLGHGPLGWHDADRVVLGADLPPEAPQPDPPAGT